MPQFVAGVPFPTLSRYEIVLDRTSIIGKGGMGVVFRAHDRLLDRQAAIKTISPSLVDLDSLTDQFSHRLFFREAMTHARLGVKYPERILQVNNYGIEDDTPFMEMDILDGGSLRDRFNTAKASAKRGPLFDEATIKTVCNQACEGLKILHSHSVYHSDFKPENILFTARGGFDLRIADLGIARIAQSGILTKQGIDTFAGGTMHYTPQEVTEGDKKASERTDIYSLGVILYEMLLREPLRWTQARIGFIEAHPDLSAPAKDVIKRACQLMGRNNFKSVDEFQEKLSRCTLLP